MIGKWNEYSAQNPRKEKPGARRLIKSSLKKKYEQTKARIQNPLKLSGTKERAMSVSHAVGLAALAQTATARNGVGAATLQRAAAYTERCYRRLVRTLQDYGLEMTKAPNTLSYQVDGWAGGVNSNLGRRLRGLAEKSGYKVTESNEELWVTLPVQKPIEMEVPVARLSKNGKLYVSGGQDANVLAAQLLAATTQTAPTSESKVPGTHVMRPVLNAEEIVEWAQEQGFPRVVAPGELHVTIAYSRRPFPINRAAPSRVEVPAGGRRLLKLGDAYVLAITAPALQDRWLEFRNDGADWDQTDYTPHVTICYPEEGRAVDTSLMLAYTGPIILGPEQVMPLEEGYRPEQVGE